MGIGAGIDIGIEIGMGITDEMKVSRIENIYI